MAWPYGYKWQRAAAGFLARHPLCMCPHCDAGRLRVTVAEVVDHIKPHKGNMVLFWDRSNWQALSKTCHDSYKQRLERTGRVEGCTIEGLPLDPGHDWNTPA